MATITTAQSGAWETASTWTGGSVPGGGDTAVIEHDVTISASITVGTVRFNGGGLTIDPLATLPDAGVTVTAGSVTYAPAVNDRTMIRLDGGRFVTSPCIAGEYDLVDDHDKIIIDDAGVVGLSATMQDIKPEGYAPAYARRVSNNVRYQTITVHIRADCLGIVGRLMRMADGPNQVLAITNSAVIKGYIENLAPVADVGKEYITYRLTIAEGLRWGTT